MVKNVWVQPQTAVQQFVANEYVAACHDINKVYKFKCDAPTEWGSGLVFVETNDQPGLQYNPFNPKDSDELRSSYHPCGATHEAPTTDTFLNGYYVHDLESVFKPTPIIIWTGLNDDNTHCTTNLNMSSWETEKS